MSDLLDRASEDSRPDVHPAQGSETVFAPSLETAPASTTGGAESPELHTAYAEIQTRLGNLEAALDAIAKQVSFLPPQIRLLIGKVDGVATAISEPHYRSVLLSLLGVYDLVDQMLRALPPESSDDLLAEHRRNYQVLRAQLKQILEVNGLIQIAADGVFDPAWHRAIQRVACDDPALDGQILTVVRPGFRTEQSVLRYAEVNVGQYVPPATGAAAER